METRASHVLIGTFTLAAIAAAFGFVYWFSNPSQGIARATYRVAFVGSVSGLRAGASVLFNGIRVGEVTDLRLNPEDPRQVVATIGIDHAVPIRSDTQVGLEFQGLTGIASLSLKGGTFAKSPLVSIDGMAPLITADPNAGRDAIQAGRDLLHRIDAFFAENESSMRISLRNFEAFSTTLARNSERIDRILAGVETVTGGADGKGEITEAVHSIKLLAENLDKRTAELSASLLRFTGTGLRQWEALAADGRRTLSVVERAVKNFDRNPQRILFGGGTSEPDRTTNRR
jgi:phospholipid/cholesterol/gamma-HCH transport system substrate-binding protein